MLDMNNPRAPVQNNRRARRAARHGKDRNGANLRSTRSQDTVRDPLVEAAVKLLSRGDLAGGEAKLRTYLAANPNNAEAIYLLGCVGEEYGQFDGAYECFKKAAELDPTKNHHWLGLGRCLRYMSVHEAAIVALNKAIAVDPKNTKSWIELGWVYYQSGRPDDALAAFKSATEIDSNDARAHFGLAAQYNSLGERENARENYLRALKADPAFAAAYLALVDLTTSDEKLDSIIKRAQRALKRTGQNPDQTSKFHFAIGRARRKFKQYDDAFASYARANDTLKRAFPFNIDSHRRFVNSLIESFQPEVFENLQDAALDSDVPVFLVGMPRSGSTLAEQILSSHPDTADAGEFWKMLSISSILRNSKNTPLKYPRDIAQFSPRRLREIGSDYLNALQQGRPVEARRITDKMLGNVFNLGLIALLFPRAKIVYCRRDPMDTCLSCYFQAFADTRRLSYTTDLESLGHFYRETERLMAHWRAVLPTKIFDLSYEEMVADQAATSRRLVEHVGLEWDDACIDFHRHERGVRTASYAQVRKPIYNSSIGAWRKYEAHLKPLKDALGVG